MRPRQALAWLPLLALGGCSSWGYLRYESTRSMPQRIPGVCEVAVDTAPDWLAGASGAGMPRMRPDDLLKYARLMVEQDLTANVCGGAGAAAGARVEVELRRVDGSRRLHWMMYGPQGFLAMLGAPIFVWEGHASVVLRVRRGSGIAGEYVGSSQVGRYQGAYYGTAWQPADRSGGGICAEALRLAMEDAKAKLVADRGRLVNALGAAPAAAAPTTPGEGLPTIAVVDLKAEGVGSSDAAILSELLRGELVRAGTVRLVEKANMDKILAEQAFQQTGCTSQECAVKVGKLLNVRRMVVGTFGRLLGSYVVQVRVIDVETGAAAISDEARGEKSDEVQRSVKEMAARVAAAIR